MSLSFRLIFAKNSDEMADTDGNNNELAVPDGQQAELVEEVLDSDYMIQPISFTLARYAGDTTKIKLMVTLIDKLQVYIKQRLKNALVELPLFTDDESNSKIRFKVEMKSICSEPKRYNEIKKLLVELAHMPIEMPVKDLSNNTDYIKYTTFCSVLWPKEKQYRLQFYVDLEKDVAQKLLNLKEFGYQKYLKQVIMTSHSRYTQRLYMLITAWKFQGYVEYSVKFLRELLQLEDKYTRWAAFLKKVIMVAEAELYEQFQKGVSECYFKYTLKYSSGKPGKKEPDTIYFQLFLSQKELENMAIRSVYYMRILCERKMQQMGVSKTNINKFMKQVKDEQIAALDEMLGGLQAKLQREVSTISNSSRYATEACKNFLADLKRPKAAKPLADPMETPLANDAKESMLFFGYIKGVVTQEQYETWFEPIKLAGVQEHAGKKRVTLLVPNEFFANHIDSNYQQVLKGAVEQIAGPDSLLRYVYGS